jgi:hypothetical protein
MKKLYRYNEKNSCYFYDEAWIDDDEVVEHVGQVGTKGRTISHEISPTLSDEQNVLNVLQPALNGGYTEISREEQSVIAIEYLLEQVTNEALSKRHSLENRLNETLGWLGIGHCDGGSIGSGTMEVFCLLVDFDIGRQAIIEDLANTEFDDYERMFRFGE